MTNPTSIPRMQSMRRQAIQVNAPEIVTSQFLSENQCLPRLLTPKVQGIDLLEWIGSQREFVNGILARDGGILFRGFNLSGISEFENFAKAYCGDLLTYRERSSPRKEVGAQVYTSTEYPADQPIFLHNENSYQQTFPLKILFYCVTPAATGGETPIADMRKVYQKIPASIRQKFEEKQVMYVRNFGQGFGLPWQTVFQTNEKAEVEQYCRAAGIGVEWYGNDQLRTRQVRPAVARHPRTQDLVWFNHGVFFHVTTLPPRVQEALLKEFKTEELPSNTYYGDGSPIEDSVLETLREIHYGESVPISWHTGDLLLLDNMLVSHGRNSFTGTRKVVVAMAEPFSLEGAGTHA